MARRSGGGGRSRSRSSSGGIFSSRSSSRSSTSARKPDPKPVASAPPPAPAKAAPVSNGSGIGAAVVDGVGWGVGSSIGHRVADAVMGPRVIKHETVSSSASGERASAQTAPGMESLACAAPIKAFQDCLNQNATDISKCQFFMNKLSECSKNSDSSTFKRLNDR